ncbi:hypothetical protein SCHPADRAFT_890278 [Schizopora paradoxa]|uniref:Uncharacterized protein n=1 Tax=Schizopora paradoxa TaxID=27342 RepID=A0A0H2RNB0_9AGAM|nr:hypothetical protein SCHPADRAFT_890278 [Schizopora paradoxa]
MTRSDWSCTTELNLRTQRLVSLESPGVKSAEASLSRTPQRNDSLINFQESLRSQDEPILRLLRPNTSIPLRLERLSIHQPAYKAVTAPTCTSTNFKLQLPKVHSSKLPSKFKKRAAVPPRTRPPSLILSFSHSLILSGSQVPQVPLSSIPLALAPTLAMTVAAYIRSSYVTEVRSGRTRRIPNSLFDSDRLFLLEVKLYFLKRKLDARSQFRIESTCTYKRQISKSTTDHRRQAPDFNFKYYFSSKFSFLSPPLGLTIDILPMDSWAPLPTDLQLPSIFDLRSSSLGHQNASAQILKQARAYHTNTMTPSVKIKPIESRISILLLFLSVCVALKRSTHLRMRAHLSSRYPTATQFLQAPERVRDGVDHPQPTLIMREATSDGEKCGGVCRWWRVDLALVEGPEHAAERKEKLFSMHLFKWAMRSRIIVNAAFTK